jgi:hypothetical protein
LTVDQPTRVPYPVRRAHPTGSHYACARRQQPVRRPVAARTPPNGSYRSKEPQLEVEGMGQKEHLPSVSDKEQKMYEHIKASERRRGHTLKESKAIAAATVTKHHNESDHKSGK